jgi:hypothetical protein
MLFMTGYPPETLKALGMLPEGPSLIEEPFPIQEPVREVRENVRGR